MIAIIDYGMGNVRSLQHAFETLGHAVTISADPNEIGNATHVVLPGVGAFGNAMLAIQDRNLLSVLKHLALVEQKPILGICLGMQLFANGSAEHGRHEGLGWLNAEIEPLQVSNALKVPHVGWNDLQFPKDDWLFKGIRPEEANFYFVHGFHMVCRDADDVLATTDYGGSVTAVVRSRNLVAAQFHPEKSQDNGLKFLENWVCGTAC